MRIENGQWAAAHCPFSFLKRMIVPSPIGESAIGKPLHTPPTAARSAYLDGFDSPLASLIAYWRSFFKGIHDVLRSCFAIGCADLQFSISFAEPFGFLNSQFSILNSQFSILNSQFSIPFQPFLKLLHQNVQLRFAGATQ
ncbi:MAG: hypothetical protein IPN95_32540 [Bacteroidetes bacterium]|nr:hypothetical protein [Bacteroidota bacterium]